MVHSSDENGESGGIRLQKVLRDASGISRRHAEDAIVAGRVKVNGKVATLGMRVDLDTDVVMMDGKPIKSTPTGTKTTIMLNKRGGCVTTRSDPNGRPTVFHSLPQDFRRLFPVGRLDYETEGLLLLTDDGDLAYRLTHPKFEVEKEYEAHLDAPLSKTDRERLERGLKTPELITSPAKLHMIGTDGTCWRVTIHEGKNREVRRMFEAVGLRVTALKRVRVGGLALGDVKVGSWRKLTQSDIKKLETVAAKHLRT